MDESASPAELQYVYYDLQQKLKSKFSGFEVKLGGLFDIIPNRLKIGANITFPSKFKVDEKWSVNDDLAYDIIRANIDSSEMISSPYEEWGDFDYYIKVPFKFSAGLAFNYSIFLVSASVDYQDWSQLKYDIPDDRPHDAYTNLLDQNQVFKDEYQSITTFSIGGELSLLEDRLKLRGGLREVPSPLKELGADYNKRYISSGLGYKVDKNTIIHLTYVRGSWKNDKYYYFDAFDDDGALPLETSEEYVSTKILIGAQFNFR
jgi:long-subunit fatty acid transport protein